MSTYTLFTAGSDGTWWRHDYPDKAARWEALKEILSHVEKFSLEDGPGQLASTTPSGIVWTRS